MSDVAGDGAAWPPDGFWDYSLELYGRAGVEAACMDLQQRHGVDVNLVLLCLWLAQRGTALDGEMIARLCHAADRWQVEVVRPLRALRKRLKTRLADREPNSVATGWPEIAASIRQRVVALEIDAEHLEQLHLSRVARGLPTDASSGLELASANLRNYWRFDRRDHKALRTLLEHGFPPARPAELDAALRWLDGADA
jgi:uncharacterized protein (TIGR02444 family)